MNAPLRPQARVWTEPVERNAPCANENKALYDELEMRYESGFAQWIIDDLNKRAMKKGL